MNKKITISSELIYILAPLITALGTVILTMADYGISMLVAFPYIISLKISVLTFGQISYIIQGLLFILLMIMLRKIKALYIFSFISAFIFGITLDFWQKILSWTDLVSYAADAKTGLRIIIFIVGFLLNAFGVTLYFKTYFYPQVYEFFVKEISKKYKIPFHRFKHCFDIAFLGIDICLACFLFHRLRGIGAGTVLIALLNGPLIHRYDDFLERYFNIRPIFSKFAEKFKIE